MKYFLLFLITLSLIFAFTNCAPPANDDVASEKIGHYESPFAKDKLKLQTPTFKKVRTKNSVKNQIFDSEIDAIPSSVIVSLSCAAAECLDSQSSEQLGRLSCFGYRQATKQSWPAQINRYSFTFNFAKGETIEEIRSKFEADGIDQKCIVGVSNYAELHLTETRLNDPDTLLTNTNYANSPYLDQIGFFDQISFIHSLKTTLANIRVGVIDGDFYPYYGDLNGNYSTNINGYGKSFRIDGSIINVGGAPLPSDCAGNCHGSLVSALIAGTNGNSTFGAGIAAGPAADYSDAKIVAANIYSIDPASGSKVITVDSVNNALSLMAFLKVDVINMSLAYEDYAGAGPQTLLATILSAIGQGCVVVVSAGNNSVNMTTKKRKDGTDAKTLSYPGAWGADYLGLISAAAMNRSGTDLALFSNYGEDNVDIAAPGEYLLVGGKSISGTSFSAPIVSGAVAITKAYYRSIMGAQADISAAQIELSLLSGAKKVDALNGFVKNSATLNLNNLQQKLSTQAISLSPSAKLDTDGFWYTREGSSMNYAIRTMTSNIPDNETSYFIGIWEKLDMSLPPLAKSPAANGVNNFDLPFHQFLVGDEGIWVVLYKLGSGNKRIPLSSKLYKFTDLVIQPTQAASRVLGEINQVSDDVSGWACLEGRPDRIQIDVRTGSADGPSVVKQMVSHQPKGRGYFEDCAPFTIRLGFNFPLTFFKKDVSYFFVALHPTDAQQNKLLNSQPFIIEDTQYSDPVVHTIKKTIDNEKIVVSGQVCWVDQETPGLISNYIEPLMFDRSLGLNPYVLTWLENIMRSHTTLWNYYKEVVTYVNHAGATVNQTGRFFLNGYKFGFAHKAWSTTEGVNLQFPIAGINTFTTPIKKKDVSYADAIEASGQYGIVHIGYLDHPDGKIVNDSGGNFLYQEFKPFFIDAWHPSMIDEPISTLASVGTSSQRMDILSSAYYPYKKPTIYNERCCPDLVSTRPAWDVPSNIHGSQLTTSAASDACTKVQKTGAGQNFTITYTRATIMSDFVISTSLNNGLVVANFNNVTNLELEALFNAFNQSYKTAVVSTGAQLGKTIVDNGQVHFNLRFLSVTSGAKYESFYLKDVPNR